MIRRIAKDSMIYGGADFATKILLFFTFPIIAAALSPKAFGSLELITTATSLMGVVMNCGLNNAAHRFYWDKDTLSCQRPVIVSSGFFAQALFGVVIILLGLASLPAILPEVEYAELPLTWVALVAALLLMLFRQWEQYMLDVVRLHFAPFKFLIISSISRGGISLATVLVVVLLHWKIDGILFIQACVALVVFPLSLWIIRKDLTFKISRIWIMELVRYGYPFIFTGIAYWIFGSMDRWMLASMSSIEEVGIYSIAFRFATIVLFLSNAFGSAWSPLAMKLRTDNPKTYRAIYADVLMILLFVMLIVGGGLALFSGELIVLIMPHEYNSSALPLAILCFGVILQSTQQVTAIGISLEKKTIIFTHIAWMTALLNLVLNWLFIPNYGAIGAAWATTISYFVLTTSYLLCTQRLHPLPIPWKNLICLILLGSIVCIIAVLFNSTIFTFKTICAKLLFSMLCAGLGWFLLPIKSFCYEN